MKYRVVDKATGAVHFLTADELARIPSRPRASESRHRWPVIPEKLDRTIAIKLIRDALRKRSGKAWSVTGGRGTAYGWITISAPPARCVYDSDGNRTDSEFGYMGRRDREELARLLGLDHVHMQGETVAASNDYRLEYIARARGQTPTVHGTQYWD